MSLLLSLEDIYSILQDYKFRYRHNLRDDVKNIIDHLNCFNTIFRDYQINSISWMIEKEIINLQYSLSQLFLNKDSLKSLLLVDTHIKSNDKDEAIQVQRDSSNYITQNVSKKADCKFEIINGGILADEMGLGKTVELLAVILINKKINYVEILKMLRDVLRDEKPLHKSNSSLITKFVMNYLSYIIEKLNPFDKKDLSNILPQHTILQNNYCNIASTNGIPNKNSSQQIACICGLNNSRRKPQECIKCHTLQHPKCVNYNEDLVGKSFICCYCAVTNMTYYSNATLIITPNSISDQWITEIHKHLNLNENNIKIMKYNGVHRMMYNFVYPNILAQQDIVVTTYEVLIRELDHADLSYDSMKQLRSPKRFLPLPSPLTCIHWWRVCFDEAQMVESPSTKVAKMAHHLRAFHRWCITGTPLQKGIDDLYGLLNILQVPPYDQRSVWDAFIAEPFNRGDTQPLATLFNRLMWRTRKEDVIDQLGIPAQTEQVYRLTFSPVEAHFYHRQHEESLKATRKAIREVTKFTDPIAIDQGFEENHRQDFTAVPKEEEEELLESLNPGSVAKLLYPLVKLRLACCHPQIVLVRENVRHKRGKYLGGKMPGQDLTGGLGRQVVSLHKRIMSMDEILETLVKKSTVESEEIHRTIISAFNGLAGIEFIRFDYGRAVQWYERVFDSYFKYKAHFETDALQRVHACYNMRSALLYRSAPASSTPPPESLAKYDHKFLREEEDKLRSEYLKNHETEVDCKRTALTRLSAALSEPEVSKFNYAVSSCSSSKSDYWWMEALARFQELGTDSDIIDKFLQENLFKSLDDNRYFTVKTYQMKMLSCLEKLCKTRREILAKLEVLSAPPSVQDIEVAVGCHLDYFHSKAGKNKENTPKKLKSNNEKCSYCLLEQDFRAYEGLVFLLQKSDKDLEGRFVVDFDENSDFGDKDCEDIMVSMNGGPNDGGVWKESHLEKALKIVYGGVKNTEDVILSELKESGRAHFKWLELVKREYKVAHDYLAALINRVSALDELNMSVTRLQLKDSENSASTSKGEERVAQNLIASHQLAEQEFVFKGQVDLCSCELEKKLGQLYYLKNLQKRQDTLSQDDGGDDTNNTNSTNSNNNNNACPICLTPLHTEWNVLLCGHFFCFACMERLMKGGNSISTNTNQQGLKCPLCRHSTPKAEISWVSTEQSRLVQELGLENVALKGSHSTKISGVIAALLHIAQKYPGAKSIVFSTWPSILNILGFGLRENDIEHTQIYTTADIKQNLKLFKESPTINVLLIPLSFGAAGLNITEASHVLFTEPILNRATFQQAVGRVHRMGQTKPTYVYKFVIKGTIEEKILDMSPVLPCQNNYKAKECMNLTINQLTSLYAQQ